MAFGYTGTLRADDFHTAAGATKAHDTTDRLITTGVLYYDVDGLGGEAAAAVALLGTTTHPVLTFGDIQILA